MSAYGLPVYPSYFRALSDYPRRIILFLISFFFTIHYLHKSKRKLTQGKMKPKMENVLIAVGIIMVVGGIVMKLSGKKPPSPIQQRQSANNFDENKAKGDAFEKFVVLHFDTAFFTLQEWRSDKEVNGIYPAANHFPDLEVEFNLRKKNISDRFAIECKYRSNYYKDGIELAKDFQLSQYKKYAAKIGIPVFMVVGLGATPDAPAEIFIVPLSDVTTTRLEKDFLMKYKRENAQKFFWDPEKKILK